MLAGDNDLEERSGGVEGFSTFRDERVDLCRGRSFVSFLGESMSFSRSLSRALARGILTAMVEEERKGKSQGDIHAISNM